MGGDEKGRGDERGKEGRGWEEERLYWERKL